MLPPSCGMSSELKDRYGDWLAGFPQRWYSIAAICLKTLGLVGLTQPTRK